MTETVLDRASKTGLFSVDPFPHIVIQNAINPSLADELVQKFPTQEVVAQGKPLGSNNRFSYPARIAFEDTHIDALWRSFIESHVSQMFLDEVVSTFGQSIEEAYPDLVKENGSPDSWRAALRGENMRAGDIALDAQISINTPVIGRPTSVRGPHVDLGNKLFAGLFYLRHPDDDTEGGDLVLYQWKKDCSPEFFNKQYASPHRVEEVARVPYTHNTLVMFLNSPYALHGVTPRQPGQHPRLFMNLVGEVSTPVFNLDNYVEPFGHRVRRKVAETLLFA